MGHTAKQVAQKSLEYVLQNCRRICSKITELVSKLLKNLLQNRWKTCSITARKLARSCKRTYSKMAENWLQKRTRRNRKDSHSIWTREELRPLSTVVRRYYKPLYGRSTDILMDTVLFRVKDAAVLRYLALALAP